MSTDYENVKGKKCISPAADMQLKAAHEMASGKCSGPRGKANTATGGRPSKATRHERKK